MRTVEKETLNTVNTVREPRRNGEKGNLGSSLFLLSCDCRTMANHLTLLGLLPYLLNENVKTYDLYSVFHI